MRVCVVVVKEVRANTAGQGLNDKEKSMFSSRIRALA